MVGLPWNGRSRKICYINGPLYPQPDFWLFKELLLKLTYFENYIILKILTGDSDYPKISAYARINDRHEEPTALSGLHNGFKTPAAPQDKVEGVAA